MPDVRPQRPPDAVKVDAVVLEEALILHELMACRIIGAMSSVATRTLLSSPRRTARTLLPFDA